VRADLDGAFRTAKASPDIGIVPPHRGPTGQVRIEQALQIGTSGPVHRDQFVDAVAGRGAVAEQQFDLGRHGHPRRCENLGVGGELEQGLDLDRTRKFRVAQPIPLAVEHQEVGEAGEPAVEHRGLIDHRRAAYNCPHRLLGGGGQPGDGVFRAADDRHRFVGP